MRIVNVEKRTTQNGDTNLVKAIDLETNQEVSFFLSIDRSTGFEGKTVVLETAISEKRKVEYYFLQEVRLKQ